MIHPLQGTSPAVGFIIQCARNRKIQGARREIGSQDGVNGLRVVSIEPRVKFLQLLRR
jgi:hypothetical protein